MYSSETKKIQKIGIVSYLFDNLISPTPINPTKSNKPAKKEFSEVYTHRPIKIRRIRFEDKKLPIKMHKDAGFINYRSKYATLIQEDVLNTSGATFRSIVIYRSPEA